MVKILKEQITWLVIIMILVVSYIWKLEQKKIVVKITTTNYIAIDWK